MAHIRNEYVRVPKWALEQVIDYLYDDEEKHYRELGEPSGHIFQAVMMLSSVIK